MSDEDISFVKKKKKIVLDDEEGGDNVNVITTKTGTENATRDHYDHSKINGDKSSDAHKHSSKSHEAGQKKPESKPSQRNESPQKAKPSDSGANAQKSSSSRPPEQKDKKEVKPEVKPKSSAPNPEKKSSETNGQQQKKPIAEEKKVNTEKSSPTKQAPSKPVPKKRKDESESESESEESASETDSEDERRKKKAKKSSSPKKPSKKEAPKEKIKKGADGTKTQTKKKDDLVYEVLKRWWYALPEWPPKDFDYDSKLKELNLRRVDQKFWRIEPEEKNGLRKVVEVSSFVGVFKDSKGEIIDLRPKESCPSFKNFKNKPIIELCELHAKALKKQVEELEASPDCVERLLTQLKGELKRAERTYEAYKAKATTSAK